MWIMRSYSYIDNILPTNYLETNLIIPSKRIKYLVLINLSV
jgi:hypothetical protein